MRVRIKKILILAMVLVLLSGCVRKILEGEGRTYQGSSTHNFSKSLPPSKDRVIVISSQGPQLESAYYEVLGNVESEVVRIKDSERGCNYAISLIGSEAEEHGADALIHVKCGIGMKTAGATGIAIIFKDRYESFKRLDEIGATYRRISVFW